MNHKHTVAHFIIPMMLTIPFGLQADQPQGVPPANNPSIAARVAVLEAMVEALTNKLACVSSASENTDIIFESCNIHVRNGVGQTDSVNGLGNLIIGYNEDITVPSPKVRTGSHNLVVGPDHSYSSSGGFVSGLTNSITGKYASVSGGASNTASGYSSSVSGGVANTASDEGSSVSGGVDNSASGRNSSISGGRANIASGEDSSVSGGRWNTASGQFSSISGGDLNEAIGSSSSILGGMNQSTQNTYETVPTLP